MLGAGFVFTALDTSITSNFAKGLVRQRAGDGLYKDSATDEDALEDLVPQLVQEWGSFDSHQSRAAEPLEVVGSKWGSEIS